MAWIESHTSLEKHHKVIRLRLAMRWSKNETIGFLHRFWWTVLEVSPSGDITALSSPEVMAEMLDMPVEAVAKALKVMEADDPKMAFLERRGGRLLVHDWLDYAGRYLADSKFRRSPEKMEEIKQIHKSAAGPPPVQGLSADSRRIVGDTLPTLPTKPTDREDVGARVGDPPRMPGATQADLDRADAVLKLYPSKAKKDGRVVVKTMQAQNLLAARIAKDREYPWEEHARLENSNATPQDAIKWVERMPDRFALDSLREATRGKAASPSGMTPLLEERARQEALEAAQWEELTPEEQQARLAAAHSNLKRRGAA